MVLLIEFLDLPEKFAVAALRQNLSSEVPASVAECRSGTLTKSAQPQEGIVSPE